MLPQVELIEALVIFVNIFQYVKEFVIVIEDVIVVLHDVVDKECKVLCWRAFHGLDGISDVVSVSGE